MSELERALSEIADIRARLAASTRFRGLTPEGTVLTGLSALALAAAQALRPDLLAQNAFHFVVCWAVFLATALAVSGVEAITRSKRLHGQMADTMLASALRQMLPFVAAAITISAVICRYSPDNIVMLPGLWQLLVALLGFSVVTSLPPKIAWVSAWYFVCGAIVLAMASRDGELSPWMMGIPVAIGQFGVALVVRQADGERDDEV